jgi:hypothetical protein
MFHYKLSKYSRLEKDESWTSISDINASFAEQKLTETEYLSWEDSYITVIMNFLDEVNVESLKIVRLEDNRGLEADDKRYFNLNDPYIKIRGGESLSDDRLETVFRLCLREVLWIRAEHINGTYVTFGYDFYVNLGSPKKLHADNLNTTQNKLYLRMQSEDPHE